MALPSSSSSSSRDAAGGNRSGAPTGLPLVGCRAGKGQEGKRATVSGTSHVLVREQRTTSAASTMTMWMGLTLGAAQHPSGKQN